MWIFRSVCLLGQNIYSEGVEIDPRKMEGIMNWYRPLSPIDIQSFIGLAGYYRRFVYGFKINCFSFDNLDPKKVMFEWLDAGKKGFQFVKFELTITSVLTMPKGNKGIVVYRDASEWVWVLSSCNIVSWYHMPLVNWRFMIRTTQILTLK